MKGDEIIKLFNDIIHSASDDEINQALCHKLKTEEKLEVLKKISTERKLILIQNLTFDGN